MIKGHEGIPASRFVAGKCKGTKGGSRKTACAVGHPAVHTAELLNDHLKKNRINQIWPSPRQLPYLNALRRGPFPYSDT